LNQVPITKNFNHLTIEKLEEMQGKRGQQIEEARLFAAEPKLAPTVHF
jgi:hypothetical protein